jgi:hypothetical protein
MNNWPALSATEIRVLSYCLKAETARSVVIAQALGYSPKYVRRVLVALRIAFGVHETAALLLRADRSKRRWGQKEPCL